MGAPAKQPTCCAQCGEPAEDGFARQYCSNRSCAQYMPPLMVDGQGVGVTAGRRIFKAVRVGPYKVPGTGRVTLSLLYPDGHMNMFTAHNAHDALNRAHGNGGWEWVWRFGYMLWEHSPMWDAIMEALSSADGRGEACDDGTADHYEPQVWT